MSKSQLITCKVYHKNYTLQYIDKVESKIISNSQRIYLFVDYIKDNVLKKCDNLKKCIIHINAFDQDNIVHQLIVSVTTMLNDLFKYNICLNKSIFIFVMYENNPIFIGNIGF